MKDKLAGFFSRGLNAHHIRFGVFRLLLYLFLIGISYVYLYPFLYIAVTSLKSPQDLFQSSVVWIPRAMRLENFKIAFRLMDYGRYLGNTVFLTLMCTLGHLLSCSFIAYGFARYDFPGKKLLFGILLLVIILPPQLLIVPTYMVFLNLGWLSGYLPMIVPTFFGLGLNGGLILYIYRQFYLNLPRDLEHAAKIDGCNYITTFFRIMMPISKAPMLVSLVLSMVWHWNDYFEPSIYATKSNLMLLPQKTYALINLVENPPMDLLAEMAADAGNPINSAVLMAGMLLCLLPVLIAFAFLQKGFVEGIERTGMVE